LTQSVYHRILATAASKGAGFFVLLDPEKEPVDGIADKVHLCTEAGVDGFLLGGSLVQSADSFEFAKAVRLASSCPVIGFPGSANQISAHLEAVLYLSVVSSRNPDYLFGRHIHVASLIKKLGIESIATAYMLVESGPLTTVQYLTNSMPLPRTKPDIAAATALAAEMMGMKLLYLEGGSGAADPVPTDMIQAVASTCHSPIMVGGGLRKPEQVRERVEAGASFIVVGNAIEERGGLPYIRDMAAAAHL